MARPKKTIKQEVEDALEEAIQAQDPKDTLKERLAYLQDLRDQLVTEGVDSIGKLDVLIGRVIQEIG